MEEKSNAKQWSVQEIMGTLMNGSRCFWVI